MAIENGARGGDRGGGWGGPAALGAAQPDQRLARGPSTGWPGPCWPAAVVAARRGGWLAPGASAPGGARAGWAALLRQAQPGAPLAGGGRPGRVDCGARRDRTLLPTIRGRLWSGPGAAGSRSAPEPAGGPRGGRAAAGQRGIRRGPLADRPEDAPARPHRGQAGTSGEPIQDDAAHAYTACRGGACPALSRGRASPAPANHATRGYSARVRRVGMGLGRRRPGRGAAAGAGRAAAGQVAGAGLGAGPETVPG